MRLPLLIAFFATLTSYGAFPHFDRWFDFDPENILVEDPNTILLAELPSGDINLKTYRANAEDIETYSKNYKVEFGDKKDNPIAPDCTRAEINAIKLWQTNDVYQIVNNILRTAQKGKVKGVPIDPKMENVILMVASATNCAPQYEGPVVRAERAPVFILNQYQSGNLVGLRGFTSTTKGTKITQYFESLSKQRIFIEKARGADFDVFQLSIWKDEKEVLIRPGTVFKVVRKVKATNSKFIDWDFGFEQY